MARFSIPLAAASLLLSALSPVVAQTYTSCNPMNQTDCPADAALGMSATFHFNSTPDSNVWNTTAGTVNYTTENGAAFTINEKGDSPTIQSNFYFFFGRCEAWVKAASGTGIISSVVLESDDLDEVDWEWIGGNTTSVETNYFGKGNTTAYDRAIYYGVDDPQADFHNYTTVWTSAAIDWYIDGTHVRTLNYSDANGGDNFPQTPMNIRIGIWAGGDASENSEGTIEWAGGETDYDDGPFTMYLMNITVDDYSAGSAYTYSDTSGSYSSITITDGTSDVAKDITEDLATGTNSDGSSGDSSSATATTSSSSSTTSDASSSSSTSSSDDSSDTESSITTTWNNLSSGAKIGVYAGAGAGALAIIALSAYCCRRQRRDGKKELLLQEEKFRAERDEYEAYQMQMRSGTFAQSSNGKLI